MFIRNAAQSTFCWMLILVALTTITGCNDKGTDAPKADESNAGQEGQAEGAPESQETSTTNQDSTKESNEGARLEVTTGATVSPTPKEGVENPDPRSKFKPGEGSLDIRALLGIADFGILYDSNEILESASLQGIPESKDYNALVIRKYKGPAGEHGVSLQVWRFDDDTAADGRMEQHRKTLPSVKEAGVVGLSSIWASRGALMHLSWRSKHAPVVATLVCDTCSNDVMTSFAKIVEARLSEPLGQVP